MTDKMFLIMISIVKFLGDFRNLFIINYWIEKTDSGNNSPKQLQERLPKENILVRHNTNHLHGSS